MSFAFAILSALLFISTVLAARSNPNHIPSLKEIKALEDADLLEIFKSASNSGTTRLPEPEFLSIPTPGRALIPVMQTQAPIMRPSIPLDPFIVRNSEGRRESIPIERSHAFEMPVYHSSASASFPSTAYIAGSNLGQLANTGAQVFVSGAQQFGRAFGVDTDRISADLLDIGSAFIG